MEWQPPESEEHFRLSLEAARMGTWEWNAATGVASADATHRSLYGLSSETEPQSDQVYRAQMIPEEVAVSVERAKAALKNGTEFQIEQRVIRADGEVRFLCIFAAAHLPGPIDAQKSARRSSWVCHLHA